MKKSQQSALRRLAVTTLVTIASAVTAVTAQAAYIATATETSGDVVFDGSGTLDLTAWTYSSTNNRSSFVQADDFIGFGASLEDDYVSPANFNGPSNIGPGTSFVSTNIEAGDYTGIGISWSGLLVPSGYTSGQALAGSATFTGQTFSSLGLSPGTYEWTWGSDASADSYTLNVGAVPIPAAVWLFGSGLLGLIGVARRKKA
jgi:hypothetical protein